MVHIFTMDGRNLAFDRESGSLHSLDEASFSVLGCYISNNGARPDHDTVRQATGLESSDIDDCCDEIDTLIGDGSLFTDDQTFELSDFYPDEPRIKALCLHICHDCNLRCRYCFAGTGDYHTGKRGFLSIETGKKAVDFVIAQSGPRRNIDIDFFGGEPLMNWDTVVALTYYCEAQGPLHDKNIRLTITTNAMLLDDEKTAFINEHMDNCVLSLDGRPDVNDAMRPMISGRGSYDKVSKNIIKFVESRGEQSYYVRGTYTRRNTDFAEDVKHIVSLGIRQVSVEPVVSPDDTGYNLRMEDMDAVFAEYEKLARYIAETKESGKEFEFFHYKIDLDGGPCSYKRLKGCGVGSEYVAVTPDGEIYPCHQFTGEKDFLLGNVNDDPIVLSETVKDKFKGLLVPEKEDCKDCWAKYFCSGGCPANAYYATGSVNSTYEIGCLLQKKRLECALWIKAVEAENGEGI
ncbi:MAG: thioether cross-link-forming SCIFF peptide maturase [Saccharofermentanales bacterium]